MKALTFSKIRLAASTLQEAPLTVLASWAQESLRWRLRLPWDLVYLLFDPKGVEAVLLAESTTKRTFQYKALRRITGPGLLVTDGLPWRNSRRLLNPHFSAQHAPDWQVITQKITEAFFAAWTIPNHRDLESEMMQLSLRLLGEVFWGKPLEASLTSTVIAALDHVVQTLQNPLLVLSLRRQWLWLKLKRRLYKAAQQLAKHPTLRQLPPPLARAEALTLLIAGHETLGSALTWALYLLSHHPQYWSLVAKDLQWARLVFHEALRLYPPAWLITRRLTRPLALDNETLPSHSLIILSPYVTHRIAFLEGERFYPERFLEESPRPSGRYFPFGLGKRLCIGRELSLIEGPLILQLFAQRFSLPPPPTPALWASVTLRTKNGLPVSIQPAIC